MKRGRDEGSNSIIRDPIDPSQILVQTAYYTVDCYKFNDVAICDAIVNITGEDSIGFHQYLLDPCRGVYQLSSTVEDILAFLQEYEHVVNQAYDMFSDGQQEPSFFSGYINPATRALHRVRTTLCVEGEGKLQLLLNWLAQHNIKCRNIVPYIPKDQTTTQHINIAEMED